MHLPLILLHGALGSAAQFDGLRRYMPRERPVYTLSFPGHGGFPADAPFSMQAFADSVRAFMEARDLPKANFFGYSMGGYVALRFALQYPERVGRITTLGTKFDWTPETASRETARLDPEKLAAKVPAFAQMLAERHAPGDWQTVVRHTAQLLHQLGHGQALTDADLRAIRCPVRIGLGDEDNMVTREESEWACRLLPGGTFSLLPNTKHPWEQVDLPQIAAWLTTPE